MLGLPCRLPCLQCQRFRFDPWLRKIPGEGNGFPLQYSSLGNPIDRGAWRAHAVTKIRIRLNANTHRAGLMPFQFSSVQSLSHVQLFATPWIAARQASLSITNSRSSLRLTSIESVMPSSHLILCCPLLLLPPIPQSPNPSSNAPSIRVFSNESTLLMRWPKYGSFSFSIIPSKG